MSTKGPHRMSDILGEFRQSAVVSLNGTRVKQTCGPIAMTSHQNFQVIHGGFLQGGNGHTGVALCFNQRYIHKQALHSMAYPDDTKIQGRCLGVRERSSKNDFFHMALYWPNVSTPNLLKVLHAMVKWTKK
eukprot:8138226-Karenia_brevis.AAC.1